MAYDIPSKEPTEIRAGCSLIFTRSFSNYPSTTWALTYNLTTANLAPVSFTATNVSGEFKVAELPATTAAWPAGDYLMIGFVTYGTERHEAYRGRVTILPDATGAESYEIRSTWEIIRDTCITALKDGITRPISYSVNNRSYTARNLAETWDLLCKAEEKLQAEENASKQRVIKIKFVAA